MNNYSYLTLLKFKIDESLNNLSSSCGSSHFSEYFKFVSSGGKRIRPALALSLNIDFLTTEKKIPLNEYFEEQANYVSSCAAIELLHTASLIHDDLPALDNDDYRRDQLSCHKQFGEGEAILFGDYLPMLAYKIVLEADLDNEEKIFVLARMTQAYMNVCEGQLKDIDKNSLLGRDTLNKLKTGSLFVLALEFGLLNTDLYKDDEVLLRVREVGNLIGSCFQQMDDIEDKSFSVNDKESKTKEFEKERTNLEIKISVLEKKLNIELNNFRKLQMEVLTIF